MKLKFDDILFFIIIGLILFVVFWLFHGSPTLQGAIISVGIFFATSEMLLWRKVFDMDKDTAVSFVKLKSDIRTMHYKLDNIEKLIKNKA